MYQLTVNNEVTYHKDSESVRQYMQTIKPDCFEWQGVDFSDFSFNEWWTETTITCKQIDASKVTITLYEGHPLALVTTSDNMRFHLNDSQRANFMKAANLRFVRCEPDCVGSAWSYIYE